MKKEELLKTRQYGIVPSPVHMDKINYYYSRNSLRDLFTARESIMHRLHRDTTFRRKMLDELVSDYSAYLKLDVLNGFQTVQDVVDNMLTRLEELTSVLQMVKIKNSDCGTAVSDDISSYRSEITCLSKKITTLSNVILKLQHNVDILEKQIIKAEADFGVNTDSKITSFLKPFIKRTKTVIPTNTGAKLFEQIVFESVLNNFE